MDLRRTDGNSISVGDVVDPFKQITIMPGVGQKIESWPCVACAGEVVSEIAVLLAG